MRKILKLFYLIFILILLWNLFFDKRGIISYIKLQKNKNELIQKIEELKARKIVLIHKKNFIQSSEGLKVLLALRCGKIQILKEEKIGSKNN
ncbi:MAG: hypothetical protein ABIM60_02905 [candidate division WOR-3 bacterium]